MKIPSIALLTIGLAVTSFAINWPSWRGPENNGISPDKDFPVTWSPTENVRWRIDLPERGNSSPIVWGDRIFVSQAIQTENRRTVMCFARGDGKLLWQSGVTYTEREQTQRSNPYCSGSPVTDGERVYVCFGSAGVYAYDFDGKEVWHRDLGKLNHNFGNAVTPALHENLCILNFGPDESAKLIALDKKSGQTVWEATPPKPDPSEIEAGRRGGFSFARMLAPQFLSQGDSNRDSKLSADEFAALADAWFDKLDPDKTGKLTQEQFTSKLGDVLPPPEGFGPRGGDRPPDGARPREGERPREGQPPREGDRPGGRGRFGPGGFAGPPLFAAADTDKDGSLTRAELKATFQKWSTDWDANKSGALDEDKIRQGLEAALPQPNFGGRGGPGGPGGERPADGAPPDRQRREGGDAPREGGREGRGGGGGGRGGSWSTPIIIKTNERHELILMSPNRLVAFDPKTGAQLWLSKGIGGTIYSSPVWGEGTLVAMSSGMGGGGAIAVKPGGSGDITSTNRIWHLERSSSRTGTGVIHDGHAYLIADNGTVECIELKTGKTVWEERPKASGSRSASWSSMLLADGKIYIPNQLGDVFVLRAAPKFELLATNSVNESTNASLAASNGELFLRTDKSLWCFANAKK